MHRFCPACGGPLADRELDGVARQVCGRCGRVHYRNSKPCVGAIVLRQGKVLLSRRAGPPSEGHWDLPGGFLEDGEPPEAGLARELREEAGLALRRARLLGAWVGRYTDDHTLSLVYVCEVEGEPEARSDSAGMRWFPLDELPPEMAWPHEREALARAARQREAI